MELHGYHCTSRWSSFDSCFVFVRSRVAVSGWRVCIVYSDSFLHYFQVNTGIVPQKSPTVASLNTSSSSLFTFVETSGVT